MDRLVVRENLGSRLADSLETALRLADGIVHRRGLDGQRRQYDFLRSSRAPSAASRSRRSSPGCSRSTAPTARVRSAAGSARAYEIDPDRLVPNAARSLKDGALAPWAGRESHRIFRQTLQVLAKRHRFSLETPWSELRKPVRDVILHGERDGGFEGVIKTLERRYTRDLVRRTPARRSSSS